jgi:hypothetical protein
MTGWSLGRLVVIAVILAAVVWIILPDGGAGEFQHSIDALKQVHSVRFVATADPYTTYHSERRGELSCQQPAYHETFHLVSAQGPLDTEQYRDASSTYVRFGEGDWRYSGGATKPGEMCSYIAYGMRNDIFPNYSEFLRGKIEKGDKKNVGGQTCREWKITTTDFGPPPQAQGNGGDVPKGDAKLHNTICIATDSHLPLEMTSAFDNSRVLYTDYNTVPLIERPDIPSNMLNTGSPQ